MCTKSKQPRITRQPSAFSLGNRHEGAIKQEKPPRWQTEVEPPGRQRLSLQIRWQLVRADRTGSMTLGST
jgi:hypothetical protein